MKICPECNKAFIPRHGGQEICDSIFCKISRRKKKWQEWYAKHKKDRVDYRKRLRRSGMICY